MPSKRHFDHHTYLNDPEQGRFEMVSDDVASPIEDPNSQHVPEAAAMLRDAGVVEIILVHGTFAGNDTLGLMREFARFSPKTAGTLKRFGKRMFDQVAGEIGNYTDSYANRLAQMVNSTESTPITVTPFHWSGENHHLGRACGAIELLDQLQQRKWKTTDRVLIWGHSHGGNLLALLSNLLGGNANQREEFFAATHFHYQDPILRRLALPHWGRVKDRLLDRATQSTLPQLDVVCFGTPLRYRWNAEICQKLLHVVHHRPLITHAPAQGSVPKSIREVARARGGDYVQQLGIGGTDFLHPIFAWRSWWCESRLRKLLAPGIRRRNLPRNLRRGQRVSLDGTTLLVDYPHTRNRWRRKLLGHGIYTRHEWLPFHLTEVTQRFYR